MKLANLGRHIRIAGVVFARAALLLALPGVHAQQAASPPAYDLIKEAIKGSPPDTSFKDVIKKSPRLLELVGAANIDVVLDLRNYLGAAPAMVDAAVAKARAGLN